MAIKDKTPTESSRAFKETLANIGVPQHTMSCREGAWESIEFVKFLNQHKIKHIISTYPPPFSERAAQQIKHMMYARLEGLELNQRLFDLLPYVLKHIFHEFMERLGSAYSGKAR